MRLIRIAVANVNTTVGAVKSNVDRAIALAKECVKDGATLVAFPEQLIAGYSPEDLVQWRAFVDAQWAELERFARETKDLISGPKGSAGSPIFALGLTVARGSHLYNCAALVHAGKILGVVPKEKLPTYNVFYEARVFARGTPGLTDEVRGGVPFGDLVFDFDFGGLALEVCEDLWSPDGPMRRRSYAGAEVVVNLSASPYRLGVVATRREMIATRAGDNQCTVAYANLIGANDGLIFDGGGFVAQNGRVVLEVDRYKEGFSAVNVDLDRTRRLRNENTTWRADQETFAASTPNIKRIKVDAPTSGRDGLTYPVPPNKSFFLPGAPPKTTPREDFCEDLLDALALGVGDYFEKTGAFKTIGVALSGGRDSLICLYIARRWVSRRFGHLGVEAEKAKANEILRAFFMPSRYSSKETHAAAEQAAKDLDAPFAVVSIDDAFERELEAVQKMLQPGEKLGTMARQNA